MVAPVIPNASKRPFARMPGPAAPGGVDSPALPLAVAPDLPLLRRRPMAARLGAAAFLIAACAGAWVFHSNRAVAPPLQADSRRSDKPPVPQPSLESALPSLPIPPPVAAETIPTATIAVAQTALAQPTSAVRKAARATPLPRIDVERSASPSAKAGVNPECEKILVRMSLGEAGQELIDRMKTLKCN